MTFHVPENAETFHLLNHEAIAKLKPIENTNESLLPGAIEVKRERDYRANGVPIGEQHGKRLQEIADYLGIEPPL